MPCDDSKFGAISSAFWSMESSADSINLYSDETVVGFNVIAFIVIIGAETL